MEDWLHTIGEASAALLAAGTLIAAIWAFVKRPFKVVGTYRDRFNAVAAQVGVMNKALGPNGGESLADEILRQGKEQTAQGLENARTAAKVDVICDLLEKPIFETDERGHWVRVNRAFDLTFGYPLPDLLGMGWVDAIHSVDREAFMRDWDFAIKDRRTFRRRAIRFLTRDGKPIVVNVIAYPNPKAHTGAIFWFGQIEIVQVPA